MGGEHPARHCRAEHRSPEALKKHYRIEVPIYAIDKATAIVAKQSKHFNSQAPEGIKPVDVLISEVDGSMLPNVHFGEETTDGQVAKRTDRRKLRQCYWKEIRVSTVRVPWTRGMAWHLASRWPSAA